MATRFPSLRENIRRSVVPSTTTTLTIRLIITLYPSTVVDKLVLRPSRRQRGCAFREIR